MSAVHRLSPTVRSDSVTARFRKADCLRFLRSLPEESVDIVVTDPAYSGMNRHLRLGRGRIVGDYASQDNTKWFREFEDDEANFLRFLDACYRVLRADSHLYIMFDSYSLLSLGAVVREVFDVKGLIVWDKKVMGMGHYFRRQHEFVLFASKGRRAVAQRNITDVWRIRRLARRRYPTQKPVELFSRMLDASGVAEGTVCDPFCGSGSSAVAALRAGCSFVGCDVSKEAVELARARWERVRDTGVDPLESP